MEKLLQLAKGYRELCRYGRVDSLPIHPETSTLFCDWKAQVRNLLSSVGVKAQLAELFSMPVSTIIL